MYLRKVHPANEIEPIGDLGTCEAAFMDLPWESRASSCELLRPTTSSAASIKFALVGIISGLAAMYVF